MGIITTCDYDDCSSTSNDCMIYDILDDKLKKKLGFESENNICQYCVDKSKGLIIIDPNDDAYVIMNSNYDNDGWF